MKTLPSSILAFLCLLSIATVVSSSSITRNSSITTSSTPSSWLSPSGNFAFGFYPFPSDLRKFVLGIWSIKSTTRTLVWTATQSLRGNPLCNRSSVLFNNDGYFVLQSEDGQVKPLLLHKKLQPLPQPASYAIMHDNGNFALYDSSSKIVWQSFDYPTSTIVGAPSLRDGYHLASNRSGLDPDQYTYMLSIVKDDGNLVTCFWSDDSGDRDSNFCLDIVDWYLHDTKGGKRNGQIYVDLDPITGRLYMVNNLRNITKGANQTQQRPQYVISVCTRKRSVRTYFCYGGPEWWKPKVG